MKKTLNLITIILLFVFASASGKLSAQELPKDFKNKTPEQRAQYQTDLMKKELQLDTLQATKVHAINLKYSVKFQPILKGDASKITRLWKAYSLQSAKNKELKIVFTKAQYKTYDKIEGSMISKLKEMGNN